MMCMRLNVIEIDRPVESLYKISDPTRVFKQYQQSSLISTDGYRGEWTESDHGSSRQRCNVAPKNNQDLGHSKMKTTRLSALMLTGTEIK
jgi:hypothetical protein